MERHTLFNHLQQLQHEHAAYTDTPVLIIMMLYIRSLYSEGPDQYFYFTYVGLHK